MLTNNIEKDEQLIQSYIHGDKTAFGVLAKRYQNLIYNLSYRIVGCPEEAEDLTQEVFIRLLDKVGSWRGEAKFSTWLYKMALNQGRDFLRRKRPTSAEIEDIFVDSAPGPDAIVMTRDVQTSISMALMDLPLEQRAVVFLKDVEGFSYKEIADILEIEMGTVKSRLSRARLSLASALGRFREQKGPRSHQRG